MRLLIDVHLCDFFFFRQVKFHGQSNSGGTKRVASEEIIEIEDLSKRSRDGDNESTSVSNTGARGGIHALAKPQSSDEITRKPTESKFAKPMSISVGAMSNGRNAMKNLVKRKTAETVTSTSTNSSTTVEVSSSSNNSTSGRESAENSAKATSASTNSKPMPSGLSLLAGYDDNSSGSDDSD